MDDFPRMSCPRPPTSLDATKSVVPVELYNLMAWIFGTSEEPTLADYVNLPGDVDLKHISLYQDFASKC